MTMMKSENAGGGYLKNLKNPLALLLAFSLVSCHPAPAIADGMSSFVIIQARVVTESGEVHRIGRYVLMTHAIQREAA